MSPTVQDAKNRIAELRAVEVNDTINQDTIEDVILRKITFESTPSPDTWNAVYCQVCGDGSRTQGPRGGWYYSGEDARYNCFNCGIKGAFTPEAEIPMSTDMGEIFNSFGISKREYGRILFRVRTADAGFTPLIKKNVEDVFKPLRETSFDLPDYLQPLSEVLDSRLGQTCITFLQTKYIDHEKYNFYVSTGSSNGSSKDKINARILANRLIFPITYDSRVLLLQARELYGQTKNKYINVGSISNTLYGLESLQNNHKYIFVTEGVWDAMHLNGVSTLTNTMSSVQRKILDSYDKPKVVVPDRKGTHNMLAHMAVDAGWGISAPREFREYTDITDAMKRYGRIYVVHKIMSSVMFGDRAKMALNDL